MRCPRCDAVLGDNVITCSFCGQDLSVIHYVRRISGTYYNLGLEKAKVRDLSGAITALRKSLEFNKENSSARNLLGLIYYEMGETVAALSEWVLSKYLNPEDDRADYFINTIQANQTSLDAQNQTIKKYNAALASAKAGNEDLAIIQLKKVVSLNPHFLRAAQLLSLLYIKEGEYGKAYKCLNRIKKIDTTNTTTLRYLKALSEVMTIDEPIDGTSRRSKSRKDPLENVTPVGTYREERRSLMPFIYVIIGLAIGIAVCFILIRPTLLRKSQTSGSDIADVSDQLSIKDTRISALEADNEDLNEQITSLQETIDKADTEAQTQTGNYEKLLKAAYLYVSGDHLGAATAVAKNKKKDFASKEAKSLYEAISTVPEEEIVALVATARQTINTSYDDALKQLKAINKVAPDRQDVLYLMARCYHYKGDTDKAKKYYEKVIELGTGTEEATQSQRYLDEINGVSTEDTGEDTTGDEGDE